MSKKVTPSLKEISRRSRGVLAKLFGEGYDALDNDELEILAGACWLMRKAALQKLAARGDANADWRLSAMLLADVGERAHGGGAANLEIEELNQAAAVAAALSDLLALEI